MQVLIADDEALTRRMLAKTIGNENKYKPILCADGEEAWKIMQQKNPPRVLLLDWLMPGMTGLELCRKIRQSSDEAYTYILMLTSKIDKENIIEALEAGADDYITKPFDRHELLARLASGARIVSLQQQLRNSLSEKELILRGMRGHFVFVCNPEGYLTFVSDSIVKVLGYSSQEFCKHFSDYLTEHPINKHATQYMTRRVKTPLEYSVDGYEIDMRHKDGRSIRLEVFESPLINESGVFIGIEGVAADVTQRKKDEEELRTLFRAVEQAGDAIIIVSIGEGFSIEYVNPAFTRLTKFKSSFVHGQQIHMLHAEQSQADKMQRAMLEQRHYQERILLRCRDKSTSPALISAAPVLHESGKVSHYVIMMQDLSEREQIETRLRHAQKMEAVGTLVGGVAHHFNNLLAGMMGNIYLAKTMSYDRPEIQEKLQHVDAMGIQAADIIKQLLAFANKGMMRRVEFNLVLCMRESAQLAAHTLPSNIKLEINLPDEIMLAVGDATMIQQMLLELLNNAGQAVRKIDSPSITISMQAIIPDMRMRAKYSQLRDMYARIDVIDNGDGMSDEVLMHAFEPFFTTRSVGKGNGLGLSMCYGIAQMHNGFLEAYSEDDNGTVLSILVPVKRVSSSMPVVESSTKITAIRGNGETVLLADDDDSVRETCKTVLENLGYKVIAISDGKYAMSTFIQHRKNISVLIMDIIMPETGGLAAARKIRDISPNMPVLFITGYNKEDVMRDEDSMRYSEVMSKPFSVEHFSQILRQVIDAVPK
ncbi:MAG: response regulator [Mariprofundales bacterium]